MYLFLMIDTQNVFLCHHNQTTDSFAVKSYSKNVFILKQSLKIMSLFIFSQFLLSDFWALPANSSVFHSLFHCASFSFLLYFHDSWSMKQSTPFRFMTICQPHTIQCFTQPLGHLSITSFCQPGIFSSGSLKNATKPLWPPIPSFPLPRVIYFHEKEMTNAFHFKQHVGFSTFLLTFFHSNIFSALPKETQFLCALRKIYQGT